MSRYCIWFLGREEIRIEAPDWWDDAEFGAYVREHFPEHADDAWGWTVDDHHGPVTHTGEAAVARVKLGRKVEL